MPRPRALLVAPPYGDPKLEPPGLLYVATYARTQGFEVDLLYESPKTRFTVEQAADRALSGRYDVVGATAMTPTLPLALELLQRVKQGRRDVLTVLGGYHATVAHERLLASCCEVDVAVRGEAELTFVELLRRHERGESFAGLAGVSYRSAGAVVVNELRPQMRDLDALPFPDRDLGPGPDEFAHVYDGVEGTRLPRANVTSSRGCPYACSFCVLGSDDPRSPISMRQWRTRTPDNVVDEIEILLAERRVGAILFAEDNFTVSPRRLEHFADVVLERGLEFTFAFDSRANQVCRLEQVLPKLRRAGLRAVEIGVESASQPVLDRFAKGTQVSHNVDALRILRDNDIEARIDFIMFDPETTLEDLRANLAFLKGSAPDCYDHARTVYHRLELHPGTALQDRYRALGIATGEPDEITPWQFVDPAVERIHAAMDSFYWGSQMRLNELKRRLHFLQVYLAQTERKAELTRLARDLVFVVIPLYSLPLRLFEAVIDGGDLDAASIGRRVRRSEERVTKLEAEFSGIVSTHGLRQACEAALDAAPA